jgi:tetratricopeptide (TPR) repeat protein
MFRGRAAECAAAAELAVEHARRAERPGDEAASLGLLTGALVMGPTLVEEGLARCEDLLAGAEGNQVLQGQVLLSVGSFQAMLGRFDEARGSNVQARAIFEDLGMVSDVAKSAWNRGELELLAGDPARADEFLEAASDILERLGERARLSRASMSRAEANLALGRYEEALAYTQFAERVASLDDAELQVRGRALRAKLMSRRGMFDVAEGQAREAVRLAHGTDFLNLRGDVHVELAEVLRLAGKPEEAARSAQEALGLYEQKGNVVSAGWVRSKAI